MKWEWLRCTACETMYRGFRSPNGEWVVYDPLLDRIDSSCPYCGCPTLELDDETDDEEGGDAT